MQERILALSARLELSRQALSGLQEKMGHRVCGVVGALEAVKDHLPSSTSEPVISLPSQPKTLGSLTITGLITQWHPILPAASISTVNPATTPWNCSKIHLADRHLV